MFWTILAAIAAASQPSPLAEADEVHRWGGNTIEALHDGPGTVAERNRLWVRYVRWLDGLGYVTGRDAHVAPWQRVRWQRFEGEHGPVELQVRRAGRKDAWRVLLIPKRAGSPW